MTSDKIMDQIVSKAPKVRVDVFIQWTNGLEYGVEPLNDEACDLIESFGHEPCCGVYYMSLPDWTKLHGAILDANMRINAKGCK